jgi:uncharacterized ferritin-like protein (DUF455 family)
MPPRLEDTKVVCGVTLRRDPAREDCFDVVSIHTDLHDYADMGPVAQRARLHKHMHNEMQSLEIAAQSLADFSDGPWDVRLSLARQCWDETRHTRLLYQRLRDIGGRKGEFPVMNYEWSVTCMMDSLVARLALQNRTFEGGEMDLLRKLIKVWRDVGDDTTAEILDGILADEIQHVRYANLWLRRLSTEDRRALLQVAAGISFLKEVTKALAPDEGQVNAAGVELTAFEYDGDQLINAEDRRRAGFTDKELAEMARHDDELRVG